MRAVIDELKGGLVVSCQAPKDSPLDDPYIICALAATAEQHGAVGVRINGTAHIAAVRARIRLPIIGIEKLQTTDSEVYITPTFEDASGVAAGGATLIATDGTGRTRPQGQRLEDLIRRIHDELGMPVMADIATFDEGRRAAEYGADIVATTLCGYTRETSGAHLPALSLVERLAATLTVPVICEGGISSPDQARKAFESGAFAIVVGGAITGVDHLVRAFAAITPRGRHS